MEAIGWRLRPARVEDDNFLRILFANTDVALRALPPDLQVALLEMQYRGRGITYSTLYPEATDSILCLDDGTPVGRYLVDRSNNGFRVVDLAILPQWQGRGIATGVLKDLVQESRHAGVELRLRVVKESAAQRLYAHLGFEIVAVDEIAYEMVWAARVR
jgi:GNAT superfamily N-acetyltransferase